MASRWEEIDESKPKSGFAKRTVGGSLVGGLESLQGLGSVPQSQVEQEIEKIAKLTNAPKISTGTPHTRSSQLLNLLGSTREELAPQGNLEQFLQRFGAQAPMAALGGGLIGGLRGVGSALGRSLAGTAAATGAENLGLPEWAQTAAQLGTEFGVSAKLKGPGSLSKHKENLYKSAEESLTPGEKGSSRAIRDSFNKVEDISKHETSKKVKDIVNHAREAIANNLDYKGNIDIKGAWENKKSLNSLAYELSTPKAARPYLKELSRGLNKVLEEHSPANPSFWKNLSDADKIHQAQNMNSVMREFIDKHFGTKGSYIKKIILPLKGAFRVIQGAENIYDYIKVPAIRNYYGKTAIAAAKENRGDFLKYAEKLTKAIQKNTPEKQESSWEEISPESTWEEIT